jgi:hypothetical protein
MANSLAALAGVGFAAVQSVRRKMVGFIPAVSTVFGMERVPLNEDVTVPIIGAANANADVTPAVDASDGGDTAVTSTKITITKSRKNSFRVTGEDTKLIDRIGFEAWFAGRLEQSMDKLVAEIEADLALEAKNLAGWAIGVQGTNPFASNHNILNSGYRILRENGLPADENWSCILLPTYAESLRNLNYLYKINEGGDNGSLLRQGILGKLTNFNLRESPAVVTHTKGTVSAVTTTGAAAGLFVLPVSGGTFAAGDPVSIAGITDRKYVASAPASGGNLTLNGELFKAAPASAGVTIESASHIANIILHRRALGLATTLPAQVPNGDKAIERMVYGDAASGLAFEVSRYDQYRQASYEVAINWGKKGLEPQGIGQLIA